MAQQLMRTHGVVLRSLSLKLSCSALACATALGQGAGKLDDLVDATYVGEEVAAAVSSTGIDVFVAEGATINTLWRTLDQFQPHHPRTVVDLPLATMWLSETSGPNGEITEWLYLSAFERGLWQVRICSNSQSRRCLPGTLVAVDEQTGGLACVDVQEIRNPGDGLAPVLVALFAGYNASELRLYRRTSTSAVPIGSPIPLPALAPAPPAPEGPLAYSIAIDPSDVDYQGSGHRYAYVSMGTGGIVRVDLGDLTNVPTSTPVASGPQVLESPDRIRDVGVGREGGAAFLFAVSDWGSLYEIDVRDPGTWGASQPVLDYDSVSAPLSTVGTSRPCRCFRTASRSARPRSLPRSVEMTQGRLPRTSS